MPSVVDLPSLVAAASAAGLEQLADRSVASTLCGLVSRALLTPPIAKKVPKSVFFGAVAEDRSKGSPEKLLDPPVERVDPYYWIRDDERKDAEVLSLVRRENAHTREVCRPLAQTRQAVYDEILSHINETDSSFPYRRDEFMYYTRTVKGLSYSIYCRKKLDHAQDAPVGGGEGGATECVASGKEEVLLDVNKLAEGKEFCDVCSVRPSQDHRRFLFLVDYCGDETYELQVRDAKTFDLVDSVKEVSAAFWGRDTSEIFYTTYDKAHRPYKLWHHKISTNGDAAANVHEKGEGSSSSSANNNGGGGGGENAAHETDDGVPSAEADGSVSGSEDGKDDDDDDEEEEEEEEFVEIERPGDHLLFTEADERFYLSAHKSLDHRWIFCSSDSSETTEIHVCDARAADVPQLRRFGSDTGARPATDDDADDAELEIVPQFRCLRPREQKVEYEVASFDGHFYFLSNVGGRKNFALYRAPFESLSQLPASPKKSGSTLPLGTTPDGADASTLGYNWDVAIPYEASVYLTDIEGFQDFLAVFGRAGGFTKVWILRRGDSALTAIEFDEPIYDVCEGPNCNYDSRVLRLHYNSMTTPRTVIDVDTQTLERSVRHVKEVPKYNASDYQSVQLYAKAPDGTQVPMCAVYSKKFRSPTPGSEAPFSKGPVLLYGYGSYGCCMDPYFSALRLPLLDRGVVYVIANVRGGSEMGRSWYEDEGKMHTKINTFTDFIACAQHLVDSGLTSEDQLAINGASAGGLLMGAVVNMAPQGLFRCVVAEVPFVDVLQTMSDPSIPLTVGEWEEFGNPNERELYEYMSRYCPVTNVREGRTFPSLLITGGLHDPRVAYWEPLKWAANIRAKMNASASGPVLVKIDMAGHFSASDRYKYIKDEAFCLAFILERLGLLDPQCTLGGQA